MSLLFDNTAWIAALSGLGAAAAAGVLAVVVLALVSRSSRRSSMELARELERAQAENRRARELSTIGTTIDLDAVLARALESAASLPFVDAAVIVVPQEEEAPVVATLGMSSEEATRHAVQTAGAGPEAREVELSYRYAPVPNQPDDLIRGGLVLPLRNETEEAVGTLSVFWRDHDRDPCEADIDALEDLAANAGPAVDNARRFREARKLADLDALTNLHNRRFFHETLAREVSRARRYDRKLALVILDIDDFKAINERVGHLAGDSVLAQLADRVRSAVRSADIACRVGGDEFAVILPESGLSDAEQLYRRLELDLSTRASGAAERLQLSAGIAQLGPADDAVSLFERADEALFRAKETGKAQAIRAESSR